MPGPSDASLLEADSVSPSEKWEADAQHTGPL